MSVYISDLNLSTQTSPEGRQPLTITTTASTTKRGHHPKYSPPHVKPLSQTLHHRTSEIGEFEKRKEVKK